MYNFRVGLGFFGFQVKSFSPSLAYTFIGSGRVRLDFFRWVRSGLLGQAAYNQIYWNLINQIRTQTLVQLNIRVVSREQDHRYYPLKDNSWNFIILAKAKITNNPILCSIVSSFAWVLFFRVLYLQVCWQDSIIKYSNKEKMLNMIRQHLNVTDSWLRNIFNEPKPMDKFRQLGKPHFYVECIYLWTRCPTLKKCWYDNIIQNKQKKLTYKLFLHPLFLKI